MEADSSSDDLVSGFIADTPKSNKPLIFQQVSDYDPNCTSLAEQIKQLNGLCSQMASSLVMMNSRLYQIETRVEDLCNTTQRDSTVEITTELVKELKKHFPNETWIEIKQSLEEQMKKQEDVAQLLDIVRKTKPLIKGMSKRLETIESRDIRMENLYLREKIPFHFQPHHSSGTASGLLSLINQQGKN